MPSNFRHRSFTALDSTNAELIRLAKEGAQPNLWISAQSQTAGRGRRGRGWRSPTGNLYASLYLQLHEAPEIVAQLSFVAALAVSDTVIEFIQSPADVSVKWPNDVLVGGKKISGILLESAGTRNGFTNIIIGIGMNLIHFPRDIEYPATSIQDQTGHVIAPRDALEFLAARFDVWLNIWLKNGLEPIKSEWQSRCSTMNQTVKVSMANEKFEGIFKGLSDSGSALIKREDGSISEILAGDIFPALSKE